MANIKNILYLTLLLKIISSANLKEKVPFDSDDFKNCLNKNKENIQNMSSMTTKTCSSLNSSFKNKKDKCCKITINYDTLQQLKLNFGEDWKKKAAQLYRFDEKLSEKEIREKYVPVKKQNLCSLMTGDEDYNNNYLYGSTIFSYDGKVTYDCGNDEKSFDGKKYSPKKQQYKLLKDMLDCQFQTTESNCHKSASKFITKDMLACWNKVNKYDKNYGHPDREECRGYQVSQYKTEFKQKFKDYLRRSEKIEETWNCVDKSGKKIKIYMNTFTGKFNLN
jgi:hypothetical protein